MYNKNQLLQNGGVTSQKTLVKLFLLLLMITPSLKAGTRIYIPQMDGLYTTDDYGAHFSKVSGLSTNDVTGGANNGYSEGTVFVGTTNGVYKINIYENLEIPIGLQGKNVSSITASSAGLFAGDNQGNIWRYYAGQWQATSIITFDPDFQPAYVQEISFSKNSGYALIFGYIGNRGIQAPSVFQWNGKEWIQLIENSPETQLGRFVSANPDTSDAYMYGGYDGVMFCLGSSCSLNNIIAPFDGEYFGGDTSVFASVDMMLGLIYRTTQGFQYSALKNVIAEKLAIDRSSKEIFVIYKNPGATSYRFATLNNVTTITHDYAYTLSHPPKKMLLENTGGIIPLYASTQHNQAKKHANTGSSKNLLPFHVHVQNGSIQLSVPSLRTAFPLNVAIFTPDGRKIYSTRLNANRSGKVSIPTRGIHGRLVMKIKGQNNVASIKLIIP